jgi:very-short-patch-repair endonuclease
VPSSPFLPAIIIALAVVFLLLTVARGKPNRGNGFRAADYGAKPLLSAWEIAILDELRQDMPAGFYACPQVRLKDMLNVETRDRSQFRASLNRVAAKSVDFAIIDERGRVALVIELDDKSHDRRDRQQRDFEVNAVLGHSGIPLLRVKPRTRVNVRAHLGSTYAAVG